MKRAILALLALLCVPSLAKANQRYTGVCQQGGQAVTVSGLKGTPLVEGSYPQCTITVYLAGTTTLVPSNQVFSDNVGTVLGNPFQADQNGLFFFYLANGTRADINISGAGIPFPYTIGDVIFLDCTVPGACASTGGTPLSVNGTVVPNPNFANNSSVTFTVVGSNITLTAGAATSLPFSGLTPGTNTSGSLICGSGCSISAGGTGTIAATTATTATTATSATTATTATSALSVPLSGIQGGTTTTLVGLIGSGASLGFTGTGTLNANLWNGTSAPLNAAANQLLLTTSAQVGSWVTIPNCPDTAGNHLNYATFTLTCGNTSSGGGGAGNPASPANGLQLANATVTAFTTISNSNGVLLGVDSLTTPTLLNDPFSLNVCGPQPWADIRCFGANPRFTPPTTTATTTANSAVVNLAAAIDFQQNEYIAINRAGASNTQATPAAPTFGQLPITGSNVIHYVCMAVDNKSALSQGGAVGTISNAPAIFGENWVAISSISQSGGVVTVNFSGNINATGGSVQHVSIVGVTGAGSSFNGVYLIATAPSASQITYALAGSAGAGTVTNAFGRLTNSVVLTAVSRSGTTISATTDAPHNFQVQTGTFHTIVILSGIFPYDLNGEYILDAATSTGLTFNSTPISATETGSPNGSVGNSNQMVATVYEYIDVQCPQFSSPTVQYYVYGDRPSGTYAPLGKTPYGQRTWRDWSFLQPGFAVPGYVPSTPPAASQPGIYVGKITSGAGTPIVNVTPNVPNAVSGATAQHDDGQALFAAMNGNTTALVSVPIVINAPVTLPFGHNFMVSVDQGDGVALRINETLALPGKSKMDAPFLPYGTQPQFGIDNYVNVTGIGNPLITTTDQNGTIAGVHIRGFAFNESYNGQNLVNLLDSSFSTLERCMFVNQGSTSVGLIITGGTTEQSVRDCQFLAPFGPGTAGNQLPNISVPGQVSYGPTIGAMWLKGNDNCAGGCATGPAGFAMYGTNSFSGKGIFVDQTITNGATQRYLFDAYEDQQPNTPAVMLMGAFTGSGIDIHDFIMDSNWMPVFANWTGFGGTNTNIWNVNVSFPSGIVTGHFTSGLYLHSSMGIPGVSTVTPVALGQNYSFIYPDVGGFQGSCCLSWQALPLDFPSGNNIQWSITPPVLTSVTAPGSGSLASGTWFTEVTAVGWNGGETTESNQLSVVENGSQNMQVNWTGSSNVQGYNVYSGIGNPCCKQNSSPITALTFTFSSFSNNGGAPGVESTGSPNLYLGFLETPALRLTQGSASLFKLDTTVATLTANRTLSLGDGANSGVVSATLTTTAATSDNLAVQGATASSHCGLTAANASAATNIATTYISAVTANQVTVTHTATASMSYVVVCSIN